MIYIDFNKLEKAQDEFTRPVSSSTLQSLVDTVLRRNSFAVDGQPDASYMLAYNTLKNLEIIRERNNDKPEMLKS